MKVVVSRVRTADNQIRNCTSCSFACQTVSDQSQASKLYLASGWAHAILIFKILWRKMALTRRKASAPRKEVEDSTVKWRRFISGHLLYKTERCDGKSAQEHEHVGPYEVPKAVRKGMFMELWVLNYSKEGTFPSSASMGRRTSFWFPLLSPKDHTE